MYVAAVRIVFVTFEKVAKMHFGGFLLCKFNDNITKEKDPSKKIPRSFYL